MTVYKLGKPKKPAQRKRNNNMPKCSAELHKRSKTKAGRTCSMHSITYLDGKPYCKLHAQLYELRKRGL